MVFSIAIAFDHRASQLPLFIDHNNMKSHNAPVKSQNNFRCGLPALQCCLCLLGLGGYDKDTEVVK
jgi:hypothetical protein